VDTCFDGGASDPYVRISNIATGWVYGDSHVIYDNCNPVWDQVFYIPVYDVYGQLNLQVFDYNAFFEDTLLGFYIFDLKSVIKLHDGTSKEKQFKKLDANLIYKGCNRGKLSFVADFFSSNELELDLEVISPTTVSIRHLYLLIIYQSQYGFFDLTDSLARLFNFSSKKLIKAFSDYVQKDEEVRSLDHKIWATALATSFLKVLMWEHRREWMNIYNEAESWLSENVIDVEVEESLYNYSNKFVIQLFEVTQWVDEDQQKSVGEADIHSVHRFITYQNESGCFRLTTQLAEALGFNSLEEAKKHFETYFSSYSPRTAQFDINVWSTAILIWFIRYVLVDFRNEWTDVYKKAYNWLCQQVKDDKVRDELLEAARNFVVKRFEVEKNAIEEDKSFKVSIEEEDERKKQMTVSRSTTTDTVVKKFVTYRTKDGCYKLNDDITQHLGFHNKESLEKALHHREHWSNECDVLHKWLSSQIKDPQIERELLESAKQFMIKRYNIDDEVVGLDASYHENIHVTKLDFTEDTVREVHDGLRSFVDEDTARIICDAQQEDGSFTLSPFITDHLGIKPVDAVKSLKKLVCSLQLRGCDDSVWYTAFTIHYIKTILTNHKNEWQGAYDRATVFDYLRSRSTAEIARSFCSAQQSNGSFSSQPLTTLYPLIPPPTNAVESLKLFVEWTHVCDRASIWITEQLEDTEIEHELYSACDQYLIKQGVEFINNDIEESEEELEVIAFRVNEETRKAVHKSLRDDVTKEVALTLCNSQKNDGSFILHELISDHLKIQSIDIAVESLK
ncbi:1220_t:CDS:2, partial [Racocetra fulgida]